jgi:glycosyltransferase involved in cell wall biosynthesis
LIYHGGIDPRRGIVNIIEAIGKLDSDVKTNIRLLLIGRTTNKIRDDLLKLSMDKRVKKQVNILPKVDYSEIPKYLNIADAGIFCLDPEKIWWSVSAPLKTLEYLAAEKPIIVTNIPFHQNIFNKGNCGILLENNTPKPRKNKKNGKRRKKNR